MAYQLLVRAFPFNPAGLPRDIDNAWLESDVQSVMTVESNDVEILVSALCVDVFRWRTKVKSILFTILT